MKEMNSTELGLKEAGKIYGADTEAALREHIDIIGKEFYLWLADLWLSRDCKCDNFDEDGNRICLLPRDKNGRCLCHGGGFYFSNSARDNPDLFDIDIESTVQGLRFLVSSGMLGDFGDDFKLALPAQMQKDIIAFAKSLQDSEDGYFYHPQWGKNITPSRQGRDLGWATGILKDLGDMPLYDAKNGTKGSLGAPSGAIAPKDSDENKNSTWISHLQTLDAFKEYIGGFDLKTKSYSSANNITAQSGQIKLRDREGVETGEFTELRPDGYAVGGFVDFLETTVNSQQNPENGLWEDGVYYNSINGLMKMMLAYNGLGLKLNYAEQAFESAMEMILLDVDTPDEKGKLASNAVDTYNPWSAMSSILSNVKKFGTQEEYQRLKDKLKAKAPELIRASTKKAKKFKKPDGSFGYSWIYPEKLLDTPTPTRVSQMAVVAMSGIVEGDINGGSIATRGIFCSICSALGVNIPFYNSEDFEVFIERIKERCGYK